MSITRIPIDSRSYLEVADKHHRYAKNLRLYFKEFCRLHPEISQQISRSPISCGYKSTDESMSSSSKWDRYDPFFQWLDNTVSCDHGMPTDIAPPPQPDVSVVISFSFQSLYSANLIPPIPSYANADERMPSSHSRSRPSPLLHIR